jgi:hypothetical protein
LELDSKLKIEFYFIFNRIEHDGFQPTRFLVSIMSGTRTGTKICEKKKKSRRFAGGILGSIYAWNQNCSNLLFTTELEVVHKSKEPNYS